MTNDEAKDASNNSSSNENELEQVAAAEPEPAFVVHLYENGKFLRTIDRTFSESLAQQFAEEYSRTNKNCKRIATAAAADEKPSATLKKK